MDSSSSSSSSSPSSSYGVARVSHISNPCIFGEVGSSSSSTYRDKKWKLMKWVSKLFKSGSNGGGSGAHTNHHPPQFQEDENMVFPLPPSSLDDRSRGARDKEELDRSISLSLADNTKRPHGYGWSMDNNRDFPRPFHGGLNPSSFIPPYEPSYQYRRRQRICGGCNSDIGSGNYLGCMGTFFHPECFRCHSCGYAITEHEIPTNDAGLIEYRCHPFWNQKYCPSHEYDKTARCCSCERLESWDVRYYTLEDGRSLCLECMETAITDTGECQPLYHAIRDYYEGMYMKLDQQIPMLLVQREALNDAIVGEKNVLRRPRLGAHRLVGFRNLNPEVEEGICQVLSYMWLESEVLSDPSTRNLPSTSSVATSSSSSFSNKKGGKSNVEKKLGEFFKHQIAHDASPAYGGGFRAANAAACKYGLRRTLDHIRLTGTFPL
nr:hypothetical protein [Arabidopsis thaliana]